MLSVILAAVVAAAAPAPAPAPQQASAAAAQDPDPMVCHVEPIQGSRITHKVCLRASQVAQLQAEARRFLDHAQSGSQPPNMASMVQMGPMR